MVSELDECFHCGHAKEKHRFDESVPAQPQGKKSQEMKVGGECGVVYCFNFITSVSDIVISFLHASRLWME